MKIVSKGEKIFVAAILFLMAAGYAYADYWYTAPPNPPNNNSQGPIDVGANPQIKTGNLGVDALSIFTGTLLVGNSPPSLPAGTLVGVGSTSGGKVLADDFCFNGDQNQCLTNTGGFRNIQTFDTSGTWTANGASKALVRVWGGGGGGSAFSSGGNCYGGGGGGGAFSESIVSLVPGKTYQITIGNGGAAGYSGAGSDGQTTLFLDGATTLVSAFGGKGAPSYVGGIGGHGGLGTVQIDGDSGETGYLNSSCGTSATCLTGQGGSSPFGGGAARMATQNRPTPDGVVPGGGGGPGTNNLGGNGSSSCSRSLPAGNGAHGRVAIYW